MLAMLPMVVKLQALIDPQRKQYQPGRGVSSMMTQVGQSQIVLPSQFVVGTLIGFKEVVAGLLWVRANDFFHSGNYEAIVPLTRIITWLDPHQIEVYRTGAWHLAFNFVDSASRADRRYLTPAMKFLEEGIVQNPGVSDVEFDLGFMLYSMKAHDYDSALYWIKRAATRKDALLPLHRQVAHAYEKAGQIDKAIEQWQKCIKQGQEGLDDDPNAFYENHMLVSKRNLDMTLVRKTMRANLSDNPIDMGFTVEFKRVAPRVFDVEGTCNLPDGARINFILMDADYEEPTLDSFNWEVDPDVTALVDIGVHGIFVENGKFKRRYDLSKDVKQYPFKKEKYNLVFTINPRMCADYIQDRIGWHGEGITDKNYLDTSTPGLRMIKKVIPVERKDIL